MQNKIISFLFILLFTYSNALARYATYEEADIEILQNNKIINIESDGTYTVKNHLHLKILNESGRAKYGSTILQFTKDIEEIDVLEAKTINPEAVINVDKKNIEVKPLASSEHGFDQMFQVLIAFKDVKVGSEIILKYNEKTLKPVIDNKYYTVITFGRDGYQSNGEISVNSKIKELKLNVNDPSESLSITENRTNNSYSAKIKLVKPVFYKIINEPFSQSLDDKTTTFIEFTSSDNWKEIGDYFGKKYNETINSELPSKFNSLLEKAKKIDSSEYDQINFVISEVNNMIRYMGSWQTIEGKYFPRTLELIASSGYADCKEYSVLVSAILNKLGYNSNSALVYRGYHYVERKAPLPTPFVFNHAIINVTTPNGVNLWVDPTNFVSISKEPLPDITARHSLIISENSKLGFIPDVNYKDSITEVNAEIIISDKEIKKDISLSLKGVESAYFTGLELKTSRKNIEESVLNMLTGNAKPLYFNVDIPNLSSRIVKDLTFKLQTIEEENLLHTNLGEAYIINNMNKYWQNIFSLIPSDQVGVVAVADPYTLRRSIRIKNYSVLNPEKLNYNITNNWFSAKRDCSMENQDFVMKEEIQLIDTRIYPADTKTEEFKNTRNTIRKKLQDCVVIGNVVGQK